jgi:hypothetical protein
MRHVRTGDQKQEGYGSEENHQGQADVAGQGFTQWRDRHVHHHRVLAVLLLESLGDRRKL